MADILNFSERIQQTTQKLFSHGFSTKQKANLYTDQ